jgi:hypothetical protein
MDNACKGLPLFYAPVVLMMPMGGFPNSQRLESANIEAPPAEPVALRPPYAAGEMLVSAPQPKASSLTRVIRLNLRDLGHSPRGLDVADYGSARGASSVREVV